MHNKLVRDNIPRIIEQNGEVALCRTLDVVECLSAFRRKLVEEANEVLQADTRSRFLREMADLQEAFEACLEAHHFSLQELRRTRDKLRAEKGAFKDRVFLISTTPKAAS